MRTHEAAAEPVTGIDYSGLQTVLKPKVYGKIATRLSRNAGVMAADLETLIDNDSPHRHIVAAYITTALRRHAAQEYGIPTDPEPWEEPYGRCLILIPLLTDAMICYNISIN